MNQRAWRKALFLASGITASTSTAFLVVNGISNDKGRTIHPHKSHHEPTKPNNAISLLATSAYHRPNAESTASSAQPARSYQTFVDKYYAEHKCLPLPTTIHATLSPKDNDNNKQQRKNILVIGDVHGCYDELQLLYEKAIAENDHYDFEYVILVGDLCNKGPDSVKVIRFVQQQFPHWQTVRGNHDNAALAAALGDSERRQKPKYQWISGLTDQDVLWMSELPYTLRIPAASMLVGQETNTNTRDTVVVHAGLRPNVPLEEQSIPDMITLREVPTTNGNDDDSNNNLQQQPWASVWKGNFNVVFGHDAKRGFQNYEPSNGNNNGGGCWTMGLDTGACYGKQLTGIILPEKKLVRVDALKVHCPISK